MKALVTGASSGIGREISIYLSKLGYDLILVARRKNKLEETKKMCKTNIEIIELDLAEEKNVYKLYEMTKDKNIDFLVNNAGFGLFGFFNETDLSTELKMIDLNIKAVHILTKLFLVDFLKKDYGYILNVASSAGFMAGPKLSTYYSTKNYVLKQTLAIREELKHLNSHVTICALCPGPVDTEFNKVAKGSFNTKSATPEYVARYAIDKTLKGKAIIIPTLKIKLAVFFNKFLPFNLAVKINYYIQDTKMKKFTKNT